MWVLGLAEPSFEVFLAAVGVDDLGQRPVVVGVSPVRSVLITRATHLGAQMASMWASTLGRGRRARLRTRVSASVLSAAVAWRRVWANPTCWAVCRPTEWVRMTRRRWPSTIAVASNAVRFSWA